MAIGFSLPLRVWFPFRSTFRRHPFSGGSCSISKWFHRCRPSSHQHMGWYHILISLIPIHFSFPFYSFIYSNSIRQVPPLLGLFYASVGMLQLFLDNKFSPTPPEDSFNKVVASLLCVSISISMFQSILLIYSIPVYSLMTKLRKMFHFCNCFIQCVP